MKQLFSAIEDKWQIILLGMSAFILLLVGILLLVLRQNNIVDNQSEEDIYIELMTADESEADNDYSITGEEINEEDVPPVEVTVDVKGAVLHPGVYTLFATERIIDAIEQAGGLQADANGLFVNFAQILEDQMVIYVPKVGEEIAEQNVALTPAGQAGDAADATADKIDINQADHTQLMSLNGIGQVKAENIINYRTEHGPFQTIEDLKKVSGIGEATFNQLKDRIVISK